MRQEKLKRTSVPNVSYHRYIYLKHTHTRLYEGACLCMRAFISLVALLISSLAHSNGNSCRIMPIKFVLLKNSFAKKFHKSNKYRVALRQSLRDDGVGWEVCGGLENWGGQSICHMSGAGIRQAAVGPKSRSVCLGINF